VADPPVFSESASIKTGEHAEKHIFILPSCGLVVDFYRKCDIMVGGKPDGKAAVNLLNQP